MNALALALALAAADPPGDSWWTGDHLTGDWGGSRAWLADRGLLIDLAYTAEVFSDAAAPGGAPGGTALGHLDLGLGLDLERLGGWRGGRLYALAQNTHGAGINTLVGSAIAVTNLEAPPSTQLAELFLEQSFLDGALRVRLGKQDANRDFGTPRFSGNFLANDQGMFPTAPLPTSPTPGLGATVLAQPLGWLGLKAALYEGSPRLGSWGLDSALAPGAGWMAVGAVAVSHHLGPEARSGGTTSAGLWGQAGSFAEVAPGPGPTRTFDSNLGFFVQHDERLLAHPERADDASGLTVIARLGWAQPDRNQLPLYVGGSLAWHGLGARADDTAGVGFSWLAVSRQAQGTPGPGSQLTVELFYKWRLTHFLSLQPDLEYLRHPGGDGRDAVLAGARLRLKL